MGAGRVPVPGEEDERAADDEIYSLGKIGHFKPNLVGDEERLERMTFRRIWRYLNPAIKNLFRLAMGMIPAVWWFGMVAPVKNPLNSVMFYPVIWFCVTFFRNVFVDLVAWSGIRVSRWSLKGIDFGNAAQSLFWTGFSVPILGSIKLAFDAAWPLDPSGPMYEWGKFLVICVGNGTYISSHNKLRGFDERVIRANFFRTLLAWPFSAVFSPLGNLLGVPSIVQAKFWSDVVAAIIEGLGKFWRMLELRRRDLLEILPLLESPEREVRMTAALDVLYIWGVRQRGQTCLSNILKGNEGLLAAIASALRRPFSGPEDRRAIAAVHERKRAAGRRYLSLMLRLFDPQSAQYEFARFALEKYRSHEVLVVNDLINRHMVPFHRWLRRLRRQLGPGPGATPQPDTQPPATPI